MNNNKNTNIDDFFQNTKFFNCLIRQRFQAMEVVYFDNKYVKFLVALYSIYTISFKIIYV